MDKVKILLQEQNVLYVLTVRVLTTLYDKKLKFNLKLDFIKISHRFSPDSFTSSTAGNFNNESL